MVTMELTFLFICFYLYLWELRWKALEYQFWRMHACMHAGCLLPLRCRVGYDVAVVYKQERTGSDVAVVYKQERIGSHV